MNKWKTAYKSAKAKYMSLYGNPDFEACDFNIWGPSYFFMLAYYTTEHHKYIIRIITSHPQYKTLHYLTSSEDNGEMAINILEFVEKANEYDRKMSIIFPKR